MKFSLQTAGISSLAPRHQALTGLKVGLHWRPTPSCLGSYMPPAALNTLCTTLRLFAPRGKAPLGATLSHPASLLCSVMPKVWRRLSSGLLVCQHGHKHVPTWLGVTVPGSTAAMLCTGAGMGKGERPGSRSRHF